MNAKKYAKAGELSKALKVLQRTSSETPPPDETIEKLRSKFPGPIADYSDELNALNNFQISDDIQRIEVSQEKVSSIVLGLKRMVKRGFDRMRHEHLKALFGSAFHNDPVEAEFKAVYTKVINRIINGDMPPAVMPLFRDIELIAIPKTNNDNRMIGVNNLNGEEWMRKGCSPNESWYGKQPHV